MASIMNIQTGAIVSITTPTRSISRAQVVRRGVDAQGPFLVVMSDDLDYGLSVIHAHNILYIAMHHYVLDLV